MYLCKPLQIQINIPENEIIQESNNFGIKFMFHLYLHGSLLL